MIQISNQLKTLSGKTIKANSFIDFKYKISESDKAVAFKLEHSSIVDGVKVLHDRNEKFKKNVSMFLDDKDWNKLQLPINKAVACEILILYLEKILGRGNVKITE